MVLTNGQITLRNLERKDGEVLLRCLPDERVLELYEGRDTNFTIERIWEKFFQIEPDI